MLLTLPSNCQQDSISQGWLFIIIIIMCMCDFAVHCHAICLKCTCLVHFYSYTSIKTGPNATDHWASSMKWHIQMNEWKNLHEQIPNKHTAQSSLAIVILMERKKSFHHTAFTQFRLKTNCLLPQANLSMLGKMYSVAQLLLPLLLTYNSFKTFFVQYVNQIECWKLSSCCFWHSIDVHI